MTVIDSIVFVGLLLAVLLIGILSEKREQKNDNRAFLMTGGGINQLQAGFSMAATDFGGSGLVGAIGYCYVCGMSGIWWNLAAAPAFLLVGLFLARKFYLMGSATLPEFLGKRYSPAVRYLASIMHVFMSVAGLSAQFTVSCVVLHAITGLSMTVSLIITMALVLFLATGGLRAVVNTDSALFVIIVCSILIAVPVVLQAGGGFSSIRGGLPEGFMRLDQLGYWTPISWILLCTLGYSTNQNYIQRMVSAKDEGTAVFGAFFTAGFYVIISVCLGIIGIGAFVLIPGMEDTNMVFPAMLIQYFPQGLIGLGLAAVFAATISTGTSILHGTVTLVVNDLLLPLRKEEEVRVSTSRIIMIITAVFSLGISMISTDIVNILYVGGLFYSAAVFIPMLFGLYGKFATRRAAMASILITVALSLGWEYLPNLRPSAVAAIPANVFGLCVSLLTIVIVSAADRRAEACE